MEAVKIENLNFAYPEAEQKALDNISLTVDSGELVLLCGGSGSGKTTLLRLLKKEIAPHGSKSGEIYIGTKKQSDLTDRESAAKIGFVMQNPEHQIVTDKVWHELAFGLESLGFSQSLIKRRTAETASFFGIEKLFHSDTATLSGGEKQLVNLASVMAMNPDILILDEPTSQLDPIAACDFISTICRLNREWGITVIISEHRTEELFPVASRVIAIENGRLIANDAPEKIGGVLKNNRIFLALPTHVRLYEELGVKNKSCPLTVKDGRAFIAESFNTEITDAKLNKCELQNDCTVELNGVSFRYGANGADIVKDAELKLYSGEIYSLLGGNGAGKTTLIKLISGNEKPYKGKITVCGKNIKKYKFNSLYKNTLAVLPQNPQEAFIRATVIEDFIEIKKAMDMPEDIFSRRVKELTEKLGIADLLNSHPYDLSGGEQQKAALVKVLLTNPKILLLDEPTKGMDAYFKESLRDILRELKSDGVTVFMVTHDAEFAAGCSDICGLFFDGSVASQDIPQKFFSENNYYTTAASRITRGVYSYAVTCEQAAEICRMNGVRDNS